MSKADWKLTLEYTSDDSHEDDDYVTVPSTITLSVTGGWLTGHSSTVNESLAIDMKTLMEMILASGHMVRDSGVEGSEEAFCR